MLSGNNNDHDANNWHLKCARLAQKNKMHIASFIGNSVCITYEV